MKYQQLENLECGWKYDYLLKKHREGEAITRYLDSSEINTVIQELINLKDKPIFVLDWIEKHMNPELDKKLKQTIRARRKRHFNSEKEHTKKKSIDLNFYVWQKLANLAKSREMTLSDMITQLIEEAEEKDRYEKEVSLIKTDLLSLLNKPK